MKLNNLSRLMALLMAMMMLCVCSAGAESGIDWSNLTGTQLAVVSNAEQMISAGYCETCSKDVASAGLTAWPIADYKCLYVHLKEITPSEAYDMLIGYFNANTEEGDALYEAYINSHNNHVYNAKMAGSSDYPAVICHEDCSATKTPLQIPGSNNHSETCPWYDAVYYPPVTSEPDVSTPDALANVTEVVLTFSSTSTEGAVLTYTWQSTSTPDVEDSWVAIEGATESTYKLPVTPAALTSAYRCVVKDSTGAVVSTSSALYLGGRDFFNWATSTESDGTSVAAWISTSGATIEYILAAYAGALKGITLDEAIYLATIDDVLTLIELYGLSTLAVGETAADGVTIQLVDARYHIPVATVVDGLIYPLTTN